MNLYTQKILQLIEANDKSAETLQRAFYLTHRLEFYGEFKDEWKVKIHLKIGKTEWNLWIKNNILHKLGGRNRQATNKYMDDLVVVGIRSETRGGGPEGEGKRRGKERGERVKKRRGVEEIGKILT